MYWNMSIQCLMALLWYTPWTTCITVILIPDRFQIQERDAAITTRAQSSQESFQTTGNHIRNSPFYALKLTKHVCCTNGYIYTHIKAKLKVDGSFLFSLLKEKNKKKPKGFLEIREDLQDLTMTIHKQKQQFFSQVFWGTVIGWCWPGRVFFGWTRSDRAVYSPTQLIVIIAEGDRSSNDSFVWIINVYPY